MMEWISFYFLMEWFYFFFYDEMKRPFNWFIGFIPESRMMLHDFTGQVGRVSFQCVCLKKVFNLSNGKKKAHPMQKTGKTKNKTRIPLEAS